MIKKISSACLLFAILSLVLSSCSMLEKRSTFEIGNQYDVSIHRDFWGVPYIKGQTDQDVAYGIGLVHAEDAYEDLVELMPLYRGQNAIYNGLGSIETDYLVRLLKVHSNVRKIGKKQLSQNILAMAQAYADGVNAYANKHPDKVNPSLHPITQEDVLAGSYIQHLFFLLNVSLFYSFGIRYCGQRVCGSIRFQHLAVLRFLPIRPLSIALSIYSSASGTLHAVPPTSTLTLPISFATSFDFEVNVFIYIPTEITKPFMVYRTLF